MRQYFPVSYDMMHKELSSLGLRDNEREKTSTYLVDPSGYLKIHICLFSSAPESELLELLFPKVKQYSGSFLRTLILFPFSIKSNIFQKEDLKQTLPSLSVF